MTNDNIRTQIFPKPGTAITTQSNKSVIFLARQLDIQ